MPPKKSKQTPRNAFYYFMLEFKTSHGRSFNSMKDVADAAGPHWSRMSKDQKRPYEEKALMEKNHLRPGKYTSDGLDVDELERQEKQEQLKIERMREHIFGELNRSSDQLPDKMFFIIHVNIFCYCSNENRHYPAEIAIAQFSLQDGVISVFHRLIKPGLLPLGYASEANLHSKEFHQIAPPMADDTENNMEEVFNSMKEFLQSAMRGSHRMPILYTDQKNIKVIELLLDTWCIDFQDDCSVFTVYDLQYFFRTLKNVTAGETVWPSDTFSAREIEKDVYAYAVGISCEYHEITSTTWCSKSIVVRYAYLICDICCRDMGIELIPGAHVPDKAFKAVASSRPSSAASSVSSRSSRLRAANSSIREDDSVSVTSMSSRSEWDNQSVASEASTITGNDDKEFPSLLESGRRNQVSSPQSWNRFTPNDSSSVFSQSSGRSYAGATGTSGLSRRPADMPSSVKNSMEKLSGSGESTKSADVFSFGRGKPAGLDSGTDFPALGGRGRNVTVSSGRGVRRPYNGP